MVLWLWVAAVVVANFECWLRWWWWVGKLTCIGLPKLVPSRVLRHVHVDGNPHANCDAREKEQTWGAAVRHVSFLQ